MRIRHPERSRGHPTANAHTDIVRGQRRQRVFVGLIVAGKEHRRRVHRGAQRPNGAVFALGAFRKLTHVVSAPGTPAGEAFRRESVKNFTRKFGVVFVGEPGMHHKAKRLVFDPNTVKAREGRFNLTRAHGDLAAAWSHNALLVVGLGLAAVCAAAWTVELAGGPALRPPRWLRPLTQNKVYLVVAVVAALFMVVRNLV